MAKIINTEIMDYVRQWAGKKTSVDMADDLDVNKSTIKKYAEMMGISLVLHEKIERYELIDSLIDKHYQDKSVREIAKLAGVKMARVRYRGLVKGVEFLREVAPPKMVVVEEGEFFNEGARTNWLL